MCPSLSILVQPTPISLRPATHPLGYSETEPPISRGASVLELEFKCEKYFPKEATKQQVNIAELFPGKLHPGHSCRVRFFCGLNFCVQFCRKVASECFPLKWGNKVLLLNLTPNLLESPVASKEPMWFLDCRDGAFLSPTPTAPLRAHALGLAPSWLGATYRTALTQCLMQEDPVRPVSLKASRLFLSFQKKSLISDSQRIINKDNFDFVVTLKNFF